MVRFLSLGAGVQSTALLLMAERGEIERPDAAIFADTQWEPAAVYKHLEWLKGEVKSIPIITVTQGNIRENALCPVGKHYSTLPYYIGGKGVLPRQCTSDFKVAPLRREQKRLRGSEKLAEVWMGISLDEALRMKPSRNRDTVNRWPLIENRITRAGCMKWLEDKGYPVPPKSACLGCPYTSNARWVERRDKTPNEWDDVVEFDGGIRGLGSEIGKYYVHRSCQPLPLAPIDDVDKNQLDMFNNECEGMCGV